MKIGTKSVLFGAHCFFLHPFFVAAAWIKLYGFPFDLRLWVAFFVHDLGYWGKPNMDGPEGEDHVEFGAMLMHKWFDSFSSFKWYNFCLYHSRFYSKKDNKPFSKLCVADKLAFSLTPRWLYLPMVKATGEIKEYMSLARSGKYASMALGTLDEKAWHADVKDYMGKWIEEHKDGKEDTWTKPNENTKLNLVKELTK